MTPFFLLCVYLTLGSALAMPRVREIAVEADGLGEIVVAAARWVLTWPSWAWRR